MYHFKSIIIKYIIHTTIAASFIHKEIYCVNLKLLLISQSRIINFDMFLQQFKVKKKMFI